jgi:hypothetical protein
MLTLASAAVAWQAWSWASVLIAGTPLIELETIVRFGAALLALAVVQPLTSRLLHVTGADH